MGPRQEYETLCDDCGRPGEWEAGVLEWANSGCTGAAAEWDREDVPAGQALPTVCPDCREVEE